MIHFLKLILPAVMLLGGSSISLAENVIEVPLCAGDATKTLQAAIDKAASYKGKPVTIKLMPGNYDISRAESSAHLYHVSNTTSEDENPDRTKHIGLWMRGVDNLTIDGGDACFVTHGEMTSFVIDGCRNVTLKNFTLTAADPSVPEFKVLWVGKGSFTAEITEPSKFEIDDEGKFYFIGEGWKLEENGANGAQPIRSVQVFYPDRNVTGRCDSPLRGYRSARQIGDRVVQFFYDDARFVNPGEVYQLRHTIRNEVAALICNSKDVRLENLELNFIGNFGLVGQCTENITYDNICCRPRIGSARTDAGFADFVQMSGCRGKLKIVNSYFEGAHDDPINIHGTHLKTVGSEAGNKLTVRYMHGQSFGFTPFFKGDEVEVVDRHTLNAVSSAKVKDVRRIDDYNYELTLDRILPALPAGYSLDDLAVENVTWTPEVEIRNNYFSRTPTRGILITTRGKSVIADNTFFRIPMPAILVSDDARGWWESGPVHDLTITNNLFIECSSPAICVSPEIDRFDKPVHKNILIEGNRFITDRGNVINVKASENVTVKNNVFDVPAASNLIMEDMIEQENTSNLKVEGNHFVSTPK